VVPTLEIKVRTSEKRVQTVKKGGPDCY